MMSQCDNPILCFKRLLITASFVLSMAVASQSATLADYHTRVQRALAVANDLAMTVGSRDADRAEIVEMGAKILSSVPATEPVEWTGGSMETDNRWLARMLDDLKKEQATAKGHTIALGISERLMAITDALTALEKATAAPRSKDEDKQKLAEILSRADYRKADEPQESLFQKIVRKLKDWIESLFPAPAISPEAAEGTGSLQFVLQLLIYLAVIGLVAFIAYKFIPLLTGRVRTSKQGKSRSRVILGEAIPDDQNAHDLLAEAELLAREGHLREAIRKGYIAVLCELADRKLIGLASHKTNRDYMRDLGRRKDLLDDMQGLTGTYEQNWYGLRPSAVHEWEDFRSRYQAMRSRV